jgi:transposase
MAGRKSYSPEFRDEEVRLVQQSGKSIRSIAQDLGIVTETLRRWVRTAERDAASGLTPSEREELARLRKEVRILREEREILKKAAAFFAKETK